MTLLAVNSMNLASDIRTDAKFGKQESSAKPTKERVRCPTCGEIATRRRYLHAKGGSNEFIRKTECSSCDYYLEICESTGKVLHAYF